MHRNESQRHRNPRSNAESDASQPMAGQPRSGEDEDEDTLEQPEQVPSFLTARELQAHDPAKRSAGDDPSGERHGTAGFSDTGTDGEGEPAITDDEPPRGDRGMPMERGDKALRKGKAK